MSYSIFLIFSALARLGDVDLSVQNECNEDGTECMIEQDFEIEKIIVHPNYNNPRYSNDIALIRLKESTAAARNYQLSIIKFSLLLKVYSKNDSINWYNLFTSGKICCCIQ